MYLRKITSISIPIGLPGSKSNASNAPQPRRNEENHFATLNWINDRRRNANERRNEAIKRIDEAQPDANLKLDQLGLTELPGFVLEPATGAKGMSLSGNNLPAIPPTLLSFDKLEKLDLSRNEIGTLPPELRQLTQLRSLDASHNGLAEISPEIGNLRKLKSLNLGHNALKVLPAATGNLSKLKQLTLSGNMLSDLPEQILGCTSLETLDLSRNHFALLPNEVGALVKLRKLNLANNQLADYQAGEIRERAIPEPIGELKYLEELDVSGNPLTSLPSSFGAFEYASKRRLTIRQLGKGTLLSRGPTIHIGNTPLPMALAGRLTALRGADAPPPPRYEPLYFKEARALQEADDDGPSPEFTQPPIATMAPVMPELFAAQTALGTTHLGPLNELLRRLAGGAQPVASTQASQEQSGTAMPSNGGAPTQQHAGIVPPRRAVHFAEVESVDSESSSEPPTFAPAHASPPLSAVPASNPRTGQPEGVPSFTPPPAAPSNMPPSSSNPLGGFAPQTSAATQAPLLAELFQRLTTLSYGAQPPYAPYIHSAPVAPANHRRTLFDYSTPAYNDAEHQFELDMHGIEEVQQNLLAGLAEEHRERIYLQGPRLEQYVEEAKLKAQANRRDPAHPRDLLARDLWSLGIMMFRQHVICNLAERVAVVNKEKKTQDPSRTDLIEDPLSIALVYQTLVCKPSELQILGLHDLRNQLDGNEDFKRMFKSVAAPERYDVVRTQIKDEVRQAETREGGRHLAEFVRRQPFWQQFLQEQKTGARAAWRYAHGF
ncbi:leucine-rich repeat domain-containing protein [Trinickia acidisoli]|uniref:leucine-rich repeat domain-containing protein n=1 Tax=Trinickia acidisoli TaxID=2767482 RepID=UPI001A8C7E08|nr:hypothetical protein [Trinickia acidisoli]